jgi:hypothetical protein
MMFKNHSPNIFFIFSSALKFPLLFRNNLVIVIQKELIWVLEEHKCAILRDYKVFLKQIDQLLIVFYLLALREIERNQGIMPLPFP